MAYRALARVRNAGWRLGIILLIDPDQLSMIPVASSVGASDFALSTASPDELEARLRRSASRTMPDVARATQEPDPGIQLHWRTHQVSFEGTTISLTLREIQLLSVLLEHGREVMTADDLVRLAWGKPRQPGGGLAAAYVCSLRKKLAWFGGRFGIQTVRGVGYRFVV
jgi:DNA-binding response OmpR family regulator